jgi:uncharacterized membrane protein
MMVQLPCYALSLPGAAAPLAPMVAVVLADATSTLQGWLDKSQILPTVLGAAIFLANLAGGVVVLVAIVRGLIKYAVDLVRDGGENVPKEAIRLSLGRALALALEFQVGADILGTALNPTLHDIELLGAIVILRTVLNYFLGRELREAQQREGAGQQQEARGAASGSVAGAKPTEGRVIERTR